jgi:DNA-binding beta-propeller fold protein YncE
VRNANGQFAYVTIGGLNEVKVFRTDDFAQVATIPVGNLPHGIWPSGDGTRVYVGLENADQHGAIDTLTNTDRHQSDRPGAAGVGLCARTPCPKAPWDRSGRSCRESSRFHAAIW